jgi:hypothetical protein
VVQWFDQALEDRDSSVTHNKILPEAVSLEPESQSSGQTINLLLLRAFLFKLSSIFFPVQACSHYETLLISRTSTGSQKPWYPREIAESASRKVASPVTDDRVLTKNFESTPFQQMLVSEGASCVLIRWQWLSRN